MLPDALSAQLELFIDVPECGSFFAAARRHGLTPSAVARRIDALEAALGCQLFSRSTHAVRAMPVALAFAERARRIVQELHLARRGDIPDSAPEGRIRIDAPAPFGRRHPAPARRVSAGLSRCGYPVAADRQLRRSAWRAPRRGRSGAAHRPTRRYAPGRHALAPMVRIVCASPAYLERRGVPLTPEQLPEHDGLDWDALAPPHAWRFEQNGRSQL